MHSVPFTCPYVTSSLCLLSTCYCLGCDILGHSGQLHSLLWAGLLCNKVHWIEILDMLCWMFKPTAVIEDNMYINKMSFQTFSWITLGISRNLGLEILSSTFNFFGPQKFAWLDSRHSTSSFFIRASYYKYICWCLQVQKKMFSS